MNRKNENEKLELVRIQLIPDRIIFREEPVKTSEDVADIAIEQLSKYDREVFAVLNLDSKGHVVNMNEVSVGDISCTVTHPREVFKSAVLSNAASIIAIHNHPSGDPTPSKEDLEATRRLKNAGDILGIPLLDHVIVGSITGKKYSMKANEDMFWE